MKRRQRFVTLILLLIMLSTIPVLAVLQYSWLGEVAEGERLEMLRNLQRSLSLFRADLVAELTVIRDVFDLRLGPEDVLSWDEMAQRYEFWRNNGAYPGLIGRVWGVALAESGPTYWSLSDGVAEVDTNAIPGWFQSHLGALHAPIGGQGENLRLDPTITDVSRIAIAIHRMRSRTDSQDTQIAPEVVGAVAVELDMGYLQKIVLPTIAEARFGVMNGENQLVVEIRDETSGAILYSSHGRAVDQPDVETRLYPSLWTLSIRDISSAGGRRTDAYPQLGSPQIIGWLFRNLDNGENFPGIPDRWARLSPDGEQLQLQGRALELAGAVPVWTVRVSYTTGTLAEIVQGTRLRNMMIGGSVLAVLAVALIALYVLWRRADSLAERERMFVAGVSHEIRTPLAAVYSAAENLAEGIVTDPRQVQRYGSLIRNEGSRLRSMVEDVLFYARIGSADDSHSVDPVDLESLIGEALAASRRTVHHGTSTVEVSVDTAVPIIAGNAGALRSVLENLISNAVKHNPDGTKVRLTIRRDPVGDAAKWGRTGRNRRGPSLGVLIEIIDDGLGIPKEELKKVLEPFYRGTRATADQVAGSGLGLALATRIVRYHGGTLSIRSDVGQGTTVEIRLPLWEQDA